MSGRFNKLLVAGTCALGLVCSAPGFSHSAPLSERIQVLKPSDARLNNIISQLKRLSTVDSMGNAVFKDLRAAPLLLEIMQNRSWSAHHKQAIEWYGQLVSKYTQALEKGPRTGIVPPGARAAKSSLQTAFPILIGFIKDGKSPAATKNAAVNALIMMGVASRHVALSLLYDKRADVRATGIGIIDGISNQAPSDIAFYKAVLFRLKTVAKTDPSQTVRNSAFRLAFKLYERVALELNRFIYILSP